ncbi:MAG TPA: endolytic transglycosylase MltG [Longimicrobiales bacterium]|nr:endolytic transglycosylase MltG [Longimicrobiales bacterium]
MRRGGAGLWNWRAARHALPVLALMTGCSGAGTGEPERVFIPPGSSFATAVDSLEARGMVRAPGLLRIYGRATGDAERVKPGTYEFRRSTGWDSVLHKLTTGDVVMDSFVIPEGWDLARIAELLAPLGPVEVDSVLALLTADGAAERWGVPGPTLEGYLYPATYRLPVEAGPEEAIELAVARYRRVWTAERDSAAAAAGLDRREATTLASIVEREARRRDELETIAAVYRNRLRIGMALQADPTVQYALGGAWRERLLNAHIDSVADNPYNTYRHPGLPPGPIGSPSEAAIDAALRPADVPYLYFVARPDGSHVFTRTLAEHNRAIREIRGSS